MQALLRKRTYLEQSVQVKGSEDDKESIKKREEFLKKFEGLSKEINNLYSKCGLKNTTEGDKLEILRQIERHLDLVTEVRQHIHEKGGQQ
jgi:hypothetical protein